MQKIMFNDQYGLTKAVLDGKKTQTRRLALRSKEDIQVLDSLDFKPEDKSIVQYVIDKYSRFKAGETIAIAMPYKDIVFCKPTMSEKTLKLIHVRVEPDDSIKRSPGWTNKMFVKPELMPEHIRITGIRLERLQDISDDDCLKEGIRRWEDEKEYLSDDTVRKSVDELKAAGYDAYAIPGCWNCYTSPREAYADLIDKISGKGTWEKNPWVFVYDFELVK